MDHHYIFNSRNNYTSISTQYNIQTNKCRTFLSTSYSHHAFSNYLKSQHYIVKKKKLVVKIKTNFFKLFFGYFTSAEFT